MHVIDNNERHGVDIRVALASKAKLRYAELQLEAELPTGRAPLDPAASTWAARLPGLAKRGCRRVARFAFRAFKPLVRPLAFRLRAYFLGALQAETQQFQQRVTQELDTHRQGQLAVIERLLTIHTTHVLQELQAVRQSMQREQYRAGIVPAESFETLGAISGMKTAENGIVARLERLEGLVEGLAHRVAVPCGGDALLLRTVVGPVLCPAADFALVSFLMEMGELERGTRLLIQRLLRPEGTFIDAGANIGIHSLAAARCVGPKGRVVAFEPFAPTCELLKKSAWMNGFSDIVEAHQAAVSNQTGRQLLFLGATSGHHSLHALPSTGLPAAAPVEVPLVQIDDVIGNDRVDLIKIDVEGAELEVVEGAGKTILSNPEIGLIVEFGISHLRRTGHSTADWLQRFERMGLVHAVIDPVAGSLREISPGELESSFSVNLFFARPDATAWTRAKEAP